jgi:hypothetical protein
VSREAISGNIKSYARQRGTSSDGNMSETCCEKQLKLSGNTGGQDKRQKWSSNGGKNAENVVNTTIFDNQEQRAA